MEIADGVYVHFIPTQKNINWSYCFSNDRFFWINKQLLNELRLTNVGYSQSDVSNSTVSLKRDYFFLRNCQLSVNSRLGHSVDIELTYLKDVYPYE